MSTWLRIGSADLCLDHVSLIRYEEEPVSHTGDQSVLIARLYGRRFGDVPADSLLRGTGSTEGLAYLATYRGVAAEQLRAMVPVARLVNKESRCSGTKCAKDATD